MTNANMNKAVVTFQGITGTAIRSAKGTIVGSRVTFAGEVPASEVRKGLRAQGLKGKELTEAVNDVLTGAKDMAWARHDAAISLLRSNGYVPDYVDARKTGATARFVKPTATKPEITREMALAALGLTEEQLAALAV